MFVDKAVVTLKAGNGGNGIISWRHEKFVSKGGPDGGDGGKGGDVVLRASRNEDSLADFRFHKSLKAEDGNNGTKAKKTGRSGQDLIVDVPIGTVVVDNKSGKVLADLTKDESLTIICKGGKGGYGNAHFVSSVRQAPRIAEKGEPGDEYEVTLELKMIAEVGLVGLPNAGKSSLLSVISNARPEIANYPFTTITPNLGVVDIDGRSRLFADIPGIIEGASEGKGLGHEFLRHVERTKIILHMIDIYNDNLAESYQTIRTELEKYSPILNSKQEIIVLTKCENFDDELIKARMVELASILPAETPIFCISSQAKQGLDDLLRYINKVLDGIEQSAIEIEESSITIIGMEDAVKLWEIEQTEAGFIVTGKKIEKFAIRTDLSSWHGENRILDIMKKMGILKALQKKGIKEGDKIIIGDPEIARLEY